MTDGPTRAPLLRPAPPAAVPAVLAEALAGGPPVAPLPTGGIERRSAEEMLQLDRPVTEPDALAVVSTSGSTGRPKGVVLSRSAVTAAVTATHHRLGGPGDWVLALPPHYVAGLLVIARALLAETQLALVSADLHELPGVVGRLEQRRFISVVPTQLVRACADPALTEALAGFTAVLLGGAAAEPSLLDRARERGIPVVATYGMSETCGGCVYDGRPLDQVTVELEPGSDRILLGGPQLFSGYRGRPDLTAAALRDGVLVTNDRGRWTAGRLEVVGRLDDVVISGGVNVDLAAVERLARSWPGLDGAEIAVVGVPDPEWGTRVVAVTGGARAGDRPADTESLRAFLRKHLPSAAAPRELFRFGSLPRTSSGKIDRQRLVAELSGHPARPATAGTPRETRGVT